MIEIYERRDILQISQRICRIKYLGKSRTLTSASAAVQVRKIRTSSKRCGRDHLSGEKKILMFVYSCSGSVNHSFNKRFYLVQQMYNLGPNSMLSLLRKNLLKNFAFRACCQLLLSSNQIWLSSIWLLKTVDLYQLVNLRPPLPTT